MNSEYYLLKTICRVDLYSKICTISLLLILLQGELIRFIDVYFYSSNFRENLWSKLEEEKMTNWPFLQLLILHIIQSIFCLKFRNDPLMIYDFKIIFENFIFFRKNLFQPYERARLEGEKIQVRGLSH